MTQLELIPAFVRATGAGGSGHVSFALRGGARGYVRVYGPHGDPSDHETCHIILEPGGAVSFRDAVLGATRRIGGEVAPNAGSFIWHIAPEVADSAFSDADAFVAAIIAAVPTW